jgi:DNA-binding LytR/AlgR family response regulator
MTSLKVYIVEDKAAVREHIAVVLEDAGYEVCGQAASGEEALDSIGDIVPDVILMDIKLSGAMDGIETAKRLNEKFDVPVIYLTDHSDTDTFNRAKHTHPANYLSKPFDSTKLLQAIELAFFNAGKDIRAGMEPPTIEAGPLDDRFFVNDDRIIKRIDVKDVLCIQADGSYYIVTTKEKVYKSLVGNLTCFGSQFQHSHLMRVHRSYIVNIDKVISMDRNTIVLEGGAVKIQVASAYAEELKKRFHIIHSTKQ